MTDKSYPTRRQDPDPRTDNITYICVVATVTVLSLLIIALSVEASFYEYQSARPYTVNYLKEDPNYTVVVWEVNSTYTRFCVKSKILAIDIPLKTYTKDLTKELTKTLDNEELHKFKDEFEQKCYEVHVDDITEASFKFGLNSTEWEYEETYTSVGVACPNPEDVPAQTISHAYDGNWATSLSVDDDSGCPSSCYIYENYTKPEPDDGWVLTNETYARFRVGDSPALGENTTLPDACWNLSINESIVMIAMRDFCWETGKRDTYFYCYNGTDWDTLEYDSMSGAIYETGIWWNYAHSEEWYDDNLLMDCAEEGVSDMATPLIFHNYLESSQEETNATLDITFEMLNVGENQTNNYSFSFESNVTHSICMYPTNASYEVDAFGIYSDNATTSQRSYYIYNGTLTNTTQTVNLYSLETADSDAVVIYVKDATGLYVEDVYIKVQRYYPGTNTYQTVAYLRTDEDGKDMTYLYLNDVYYKFILEQAGVVVNEISPRTITDTPDDPELITFSLTGTDLDYFQYGDISYSCTYTNATFTLRCTVTDTTNFMVESCLKTDKLGILAPENVNETCAYDSAVTHVHVIGNNTGEYKYTLTISTPTNDYNAETGSISISDGVSEFGDWGLFVVFLLVMVMGGLGMAYPPAGGILAVIGLILGVALNMIELAGGSIIGLLIVAFIYLWVKKK